MLLKEVSFITIIIVFYFLQPLKKLRILRKVKEGPGASWSFREGQVVGGGKVREQDPASGSQLGTCLSQWPGFWEAGARSVNSRQSHPS